VLVRRCQVENRGALYVIRAADNRCLPDREALQPEKQQ
jgi:hypothetical protein